MNRPPVRPRNLDEYWLWFSNIWPTGKSPFPRYDWYADKINNPYDYPKNLWDDRKSEYEREIEKLVQQLHVSRFWKRLLRDLEERNLTYRRAHNGYRLLAHPNSPAPVNIKTWRSLVDKSFRKNVIYNDNDPWDQAPKEGWITPDNWLDRIKDVLRTTIVVGYLDGVAEVSEAVEQTALATGADVEENKAEARLEGYYAKHLVVRLDLPLKQILVEIQVCTQIQEVLRDLSHPLYVDRRLEGRLNSAEISWDYEGKEFAPRYLGHVLHFADGVMMKIKNTADEKK